MIPGRGRPDTWKYDHLLRASRVTWCSYSLLCLPFLVTLSSAFDGREILKLISEGRDLLQGSQCSVPDV